jgi:hypothetical protein
LFSSQLIFFLQPALSAAQVGIAVAGATDAARNAADLILTDAGLSPIYGAILESRRIFARIKSYVVYRVAASIILVLVLSIIIFNHDCAIDSLLVIILALLNDISMIPVAYDHADATAKPQLPIASKLVAQSVFYGLWLTGASLAFIYALNSSHSSANPISLEICDNSTRSFIWFHLVVVTELAIFSVRSTGFILMRMPGTLLIVSVVLTIIVAACISIFKFNLAPANMGYIIAFNAVLLIVTDVLKLWFRVLINDSPGEIIETDDLIEPVELSEAAKFLEKKGRYQVHKASVLTPEDLNHRVTFVDDDNLSTRIFGPPSTYNTGYVHRRKALSFDVMRANGNTGDFFFSSQTSNSRSKAMTFDPMRSNNQARAFFATPIEE